MKAATSSISEILSPPVQYVAPLFQRPYVWKRESNWEPFWETVREVADHYVRGVDVRPRFLGAIVVETLSAQVGQMPAWQIIDGQQRLTTLQILLGAARDFHKHRCQTQGWTPSPQIESLFGQVTANQTFSTLPEAVFKVWPTNADREPFQRVMTAGTPAKLGIACGAAPSWQQGTRTHPVTVVLGQSSDPAVQRALDLWDGWSLEERGVELTTLSAAQKSEITSHHKQYDKAPGLKPPHLMVQAYFYFWSSLAIWLETDDEATFVARLQSLLSAVQQGLVLVAINLDAGEDAQLIFETMNARGMPLSPADLVKNFLFREADLAKATPQDLERLYETHWKGFDNDGWWRKEVRQGRLMRPRLDGFLWNYLTLSTRREVLATDLFSTFRDWASRSNLTPAQQIARFDEYAQIFRAFEGPGQPARVSAFIGRLAVLDVSTIYPLLLELFKRHRLANHDLETLAIDLDSFLVRRLLVGLTTKGYNRAFFDLLQELESSGDFSPAAVRRALLRGQGDTNRWPGDAELQKALLERPLYGTLKTERLCHILQALDAQMHTAKGENYEIKSKQTIEHLLPQKWEAHWPLPNPLPAGTDEATATAAREALVHTLGNLTLVTGELNAALSNGPWQASASNPGKHAEIQKHSGIMLNRALPTIWDEAAIQARGAGLYDLAKTLWPYPIPAPVAPATP